MEHPEGTHIRLWAKLSVPSGNTGQEFTLVTESLTKMEFP